jgi:hypothetical protein
VSLSPEERVEQTVETVRRHAGAMQCVCLVPPEPVNDASTGQQTADANGEPLYSVELVGLTDEGACVFTVRVPGTPAVGLRPGMPVKVTGLVVSEWSVDEWDDVWFRAAKVEAAQEQKGGAA